ncbi:MAG TPA: cupin domain-containing protein [Longimicrobium sp.]|jgi:oxalate decarboxylase/phosphoglucose isomerase-like protein (cupin superfamily)
MFIVAGQSGESIEAVADQLREEISSLPPDKPQLAKKVLFTDTGVMVVLVVVRGQELPHTHPNADLIFSVLDGEGWVQQSPGRPDPETNIEASAGTTIVIPKGMCHAFHNTSPSDSVLLATFSPAIPDPGVCPEPPSLSAHQHTPPAAHDVPR